MSKKPLDIQPIFHLSSFTGINHVLTGVAHAMSEKPPIELKAIVPDDLVSAFKAASKQEKREKRGRKRTHRHVQEAADYLKKHPHIQDITRLSHPVPVIINAGNIPGHVLQSAALRTLLPTSFLVGLAYPKWGNNYFDLAVVNPSQKWRKKYHRPQILIDGVPNHITDEKLDIARHEWADTLRAPDKKLIAVLIGGDVGSPGSPHYRPFTLNHAEKFVQRVRLAVQDINANVVITTSRRTPEQVVDYLSRAFAPPPYGQISSCTFSYFPTRNYGANPYLGFLATADAIIVTPDSLSMMNEAIDANVPVYSMRLRKLMRIEHEKLYDHFISNGHIRKLSGSIKFDQGRAIHAAQQIATEVLAQLPQSPAYLKSSQPARERSIMRRQQPKTA